MSGEHAIAFPVPLLCLKPAKTLEDRITWLRKYKMVLTLDQRLEAQRKLVEDVLRRKRVTLEELEKMREADIADLELKLCKRVLLDCAYIDALR